MAKTHKGFLICLAMIATGSAMGLGCGLENGERHPLAPVTQPASSASNMAVAAPPSFVDDDFARARELGKAQGKLLFVDGWAPWCHTCLSMRHEVLSRAELGSSSATYVFTAVDTDKEENADFVGHFPMKAWPTFFIVDPIDMHIVAERGGSMSLEEMQRFLAIGEEARSPKGPDADLARTLSTAHGLFSAHDFAGAADAYESASARPWSRRNEALLGAMRAFASQKLDDRCRAFGMKHLDDVDGSSAPSDFVYYLRDCGGRAEGPEKKVIWDATLQKLQRISASPPRGSSVDDRADTLDMLADAEGDAANNDAKTKAHIDRLALLEAAAKAADGPESARVYDYARMGSYLALGRGEEAARMLEQRTKELPDSYESWARLGSTLHTLHRDSEALVAIQKAIALAYGPRRLRYLALQAEIDLALGDRAARVSTLESEVAGHLALPPGQADSAKLADARERLAKAVAAASQTDTNGSPKASVKAPPIGPSKSRSSTSH